MTWFGTDPYWLRPSTQRRRPPALWRASLFSRWEFDLLLGRTMKQCSEIGSPVLIAFIAKHNLQTKPGGTEEVRESDQYMHVHNKHVEYVWEHSGFAFFLVEWDVVLWLQFYILCIGLIWERDVWATVGKAKQELEHPQVYSTQSILYWLRFWKKNRFYLVFLSHSHPVFTRRNPRLSFIWRESPDEGVRNFYQHILLLILHKVYSKFTRLKVISQVFHRMN